MTGVPEPISPDARRALEQELSTLRTERETVAATLRGTDADSPGDLADQADELQRATEAARLDSRIAVIEARLAQAAVAVPPAPGVVGVGSTVTVRFADGSTTAVHLGEIADSTDSALVTADSPLGRALLGRVAGDPVSYRTPEGPKSAVVVSVGSPSGEA
ncbi:transcription elongation factor GreA [Kitasatospora herbaricolor]|uniref:GreA/GreB family elongation factor n=1 Tax=Kitasatospora herbaricolor TaxID=68217 RepID=UPI001749C616|nr:GreA/GreB family elongation factor [Kitasatospora herbaricolor]MDQ0313214.1 transcription elongation factor GreA [Kitasatospora herbaricolor]GGV20455.1 transcription elongation factor GreA [Kitasatospora herbaricolor]